MGLDLWCSLAGNELVNTARLSAYVAAGYKPRSATVTVESCAGLAYALSCSRDGVGDPLPETYTRPDDPLNPAPWYDPLDPSSGDFAGLLVTSVEGAETAPFTRQVTNLVGDGAVLGAPSYGPRSIEVTALLIGRTCCSLQSGLRWLNGVLRTACEPGGAELDYLECCPEVPPVLPPAPIAVYPDSVTQRQTVSAATPSSALTLTVQSAVQDQVVAGTSATVPSVLPDSTSQAQTAGAVTLLLPNTLAAASATQAQTVDAPAVVVNQQLAANGAVQDQTAAAVTVTTVLDPPTGLAAVDDGSRALPAPRAVEDVPEPVRAAEEIVARALSPQAAAVVAAMRSMRRVGVSDGITVTDRIGPSCGQCSSGCTYMEVTFTLTAGDPFSYGEPVLALDDRILSGGYESCVTWNVPRRRVEVAPGIFRTLEFDCTVDGGCGQGDCPSQDPRCPVSPLPPNFPVPDPCGCDPLVTVGGSGYIPAGIAPSWQQMVPVVTITSGKNPLRGARVKLYSNPTQRPVTELDDCDVCAEFGVSYLQPDTTFIVDGRDRRFYVQCAGRSPSTGAQLVSGSDGRPFRWPVLDCGGGYTVTVTADAATAAEDAGYRIELVPRTPA